MERKFRILDFGFRNFIKAIFRFPDVRLKGFVLISLILLVLLATSHLRTGRDLNLPTRLFGKNPLFQTVPGPDDQRPGP